MVSRFMTAAGGDFVVQGPTLEMLRDVVEDHEARALTLEQIADGTTTYTRAVRIPLPSLRKDGAIKDALDDAPGASLLGLGDATAEVVKGNASNNNAKTDFAAFQFVLPADYKAGGAITVRLRVKKDTTLATVSDTCDVIAKLVGDGALGSDICATAAQQVTTSYANYDFTITPTGLVPGDVLDLRISLNSDDTGGAVNKAVWMSAMWIRYTGRDAQ